MVPGAVPNLTMPADIERADALVDAVEVELRARAGDKCGRRAERARRAYAQRAAGERGRAAIGVEPRERLRAPLTVSPPLPLIAPANVSFATGDRQRLGAEVDRAAAGQTLNACCCSGEAGDAEHLVRGHLA